MSLIKVFKGAWRGPGEKKDKEAWLRMGFDFREYLHLFSGAKLHVFLAICLHADEEGMAFPSYDTLTKETGYSRDTISRALTELCALKIDGHPVLVRWRERDEDSKFTGSNRYRIFPTKQETKEAESHSQKKPQSENPTGGKIGLEPEPNSKPEPSSKNKEANASLSPGGLEPSQVKAVLSRTLKNLKAEKANLLGEIMTLATELYGSRVQDWNRAAGVLRAAGRGRDGAQLVARRLAEAYEYKPRGDVWDYVQGMGKGEQEGLRELDRMGI